MRITLPREVAEQVTELFGTRGTDWLAALPALVTDLCHRWQLTITGPPYAGGTHSYVVPVRRHPAVPSPGAAVPARGATGGSAEASRGAAVAADSAPGAVAAPRPGAASGDAVLKVPVLDNENYAEAAALRCYDGDGAVRLYRVDVDGGALLLERAGGESLLAAHGRGEYDLGATADIAAGLLRRLQRIPAGDLSGPTPGPPADPDELFGPTHEPFPLVADLARVWAAELPARYEAIGRPCDRRLFDEAAELSAAFAAPDGPAVLVNRDGHTGNVLRTARPGGGPGDWLLIDPKPMVGDAAFDAGHLLWDLVRQEPTPRRARYLVDRLAAGLAVHRERVRGWALIRCVANIAWAAPAGEAAGYIAAATALATRRPRVDGSP